MVTSESTVSLREVTENNLRPIFGLSDSRPLQSIQMVNGVSTRCSFHLLQLKRQMSAFCPTNNLRIRRDEIKEEANSSS